MKKILEMIGETLKENRGIIYSIVLVLAIPAILFFSTYLSLRQFESNFNHQIQSKGLMMENVFISSAIEEEDYDQGDIQNKIDLIVAKNSDIAEMKVLKINENKGQNEIIASSNKNEIGTISEDMKDFLAIGLEEGIAGIETENGERFWEIVRKAQSQDEENLLVKSRLSLERVDNAFSRSINRTYWMIILASLVLILLVTNYIRLNRYVFMYNKIKEVDEMKDNFVSMASHELKTPLTAINGYIDLLKDGVSKKLSKEEGGYVNKIENSSKRLRSLVDDILEVSRIEQGRISLEYKNTSATEIAKKVIDSLTPRAKQKKLDLQLESQAEKGEDEIKVDPGRLEQILVNLVGNSIKYTEKGYVKVLIYEEDKNVCIAVEDSGLGMGAKAQKNLFAKFYRVKTDKTKKISGTGLGLWITKQLTELMGGSIYVESIKGKGSKFTVFFKKNKA